MSAVLDFYDLASRNGWRIARPWWDSQTDIFGRGTDDEVTSAYSFSTVGDGVQREFPNPGDADGLVAVQRWLSEVTP